MALNLDVTFTAKSNAQRNLRKAIAAGECEAGTHTVVAAGSGFRIAQALPDVVVAPVAPVAEEATSPAGWRAPEPQPSIEDEAAYQAEYRAEQQAAEPASVPPGLARLRAHDDAETIRESVVADQDNALGRKARVGVAKENREIKARKVQAAIAKLDAPKPVARKSAPKAAPGGVSPEAAKVLKALYFAPAFRDLPAPERIGYWVEYKSINESDAPHGLPVRRVPGFVAGLQRRGLIECRMDKPGKYSARITPAGAALAQEAGR
jgi:hypothetical protein